MEAIAIPKREVIPPRISPLAVESKRKTTWEEFQKKYLTREDAYKYEWVDGEVEKTKRTMDWTQFHILRKLLAFFDQLKTEKKLDGLLISEGDTFFHENHRRPDIAWYSDLQLDLAANGVRPTPAFVMEVISNNDAMNKVHKKMKNYRQADVLVVWHIFPQLKEVHVYTGKGLEDMTVCRGEKICSAHPALPVFAIAAKDMF